MDNRRWEEEEGSIKIFRQKFLVPQCRETVKEPFNVSLISGIKKMLRVNRKIIWHERDSNLQPTA